MMLESVTFLLIEVSGDYLRKKYFQFLRCRVSRDHMNPIEYTNITVVFSYISYYVNVNL